MTYFKKKTFLILVILFSIFISFFYTLTIFKTNPVDYWAYINQAKLILENKSIYDDFFTHKGPFFPLFLAGIFNFIGFGQYQAWVASALILFSFLLTIIATSLKENNSKLFLLTLLFGSIGTFYKMNLNLVMDLFLSTLTILSFYFFKNYFKNKKKINIFIGFFILSIGSYVRIDFVIYSITIFLFFFLKKLLNNIRFFFIIFFIYTINFLFLKFFLKFSISEFISQNIFFNILYKFELFSDKIGHFFREKHYLILIMTGFLPISLIIFFSNFQFLKVINFFSKQEKKILSYWYLFTGLIVWIIIGSDKDYHVLILLGPIIIFMIDNVKILNTINVEIKKPFFLLAFYSFLITNYPNYILIKKFKQCISAFPCIQSELFPEKIVLDEINQSKNNVYIIGAGAYLSIFSNKIENYTEDSWFYIFDKFYNKKMDLNYKDILAKKPKLFYVNKSLLERGNFRLNDIIKNTNSNETIGNYIKYKFK